MLCESFINDSKFSLKTLQTFLIYFSYFNNVNLEHLPELRTFAPDELTRILTLSLYLDHPQLIISTIRKQVREYHRSDEATFWKLDEAG